MISDVPYTLARGFTRSLLRWMADIHISGLHHVPQQGACLLAANHISHFDPPLFAQECLRPIDYIALDAFFKIPVIGKIFPYLNCCPINRDKTDRAAIRWSLERFKAGRMVGIFPERGIRHGQTSVLGGVPMPSGTVALAQMAQVPIIPAIILGSDRLYDWKRWPKAPEVWLAFGTAIYPDRNLSREALTHRLTQSWRELERFLIATHNIKPNDLPKSAQERWKEH